MSIIEVSSLEYNPEGLDRLKTDTTMPDELISHFHVVEDDLSKLSNRNGDLIDIESLNGL